MLFVGQDVMHTSRSPPGQLLGDTSVVVDVEAVVVVVVVVVVLFSPSLWISFP